MLESGGTVLSYPGSRNVLKTLSLNNAHDAMTKRPIQEVDPAYNKSSDFSDDSDDDDMDDGRGGTVDDPPPQRGKNNGEVGPSGVRQYDSDKDEPSEDELPTTKGKITSPCGKELPSGLTYNRNLKRYIVRYIDNQQEKRQCFKTLNEALDAHTKLRVESNQRLELIKTKGKDYFLRLNNEGVVRCRLFDLFEAMTINYKRVRDGSRVDFLLECSNSYYAIQLKTSQKPSASGRYSFSDTGYGIKRAALKYENMLIVCFACDREHWWILNGNTHKSSCIHPYPVSKQSRQNGSRKNDTKKPETRKERIREHPGQHFQIVAGQLWCGACKCNVSSARVAMSRHVLTKKHTEKLAALSTSDTNKDANILDFGIGYASMIHSMQTAASTYLLPTSTNEADKMLGAMHLLEKECDTIYEYYMESKRCTVKRPETEHSITDWICTDAKGKTQTHQLKRVQYRRKNFESMLRHCGESIPYKLNDNDVYVFIYKGTNEAYIWCIPESVLYDKGYIKGPNRDGRRQISLKVDNKKERNGILKMSNKYKALIWLSRREYIDKSFNTLAEAVEWREKERLKIIENSNFKARTRLDSNFTAQYCKKIRLVGRTLLHP
jgi:hypothetical protein